MARATLATRIIRDIEKLRVTEGRLQGKNVKVLPWQREIIGGVATHTVSALSVARGNGKSTLMAGLAVCGLLPGGALHRPRGQVGVVASSLAQGAIVFSHVLAFLEERIAEDNAKKGEKIWRVIDNSHQKEITHQPSKAKLIVKGSDAGRAHGLAPSLLILDEPAKWVSGGRELWAALRTSAGKQVDFKIVAIGTQSDRDDHWFSELLANKRRNKSIFSKLYQADPEAGDFEVENIRAANPSYDYWPDLRTAIDEEADEASDGGPPLAMFRALRLNLGTPEVADRELIIRIEDWRAITTIDPAAREGPVAIGIDAGGGYSMTAVAFYWPETGRLDAFGAFPADPSLHERGKKDYVGDRYVLMYRKGELYTYPGKTTNNVQFFIDMFERVKGYPVIGIAADRYKQLDLAQAMVSAALPIAPHEIQHRPVGTGPDGNADIVAFQREVLEPHLSVAPNLALESALGDAILRRVNGNAALDKARHRGRIDVLQASILAVGLGRRWRMPSELKREFDADDFVL